MVTKSGALLFSRGVGLRKMGGKVQKTSVRQWV